MYRSSSSRMNVIVTSTSIICFGAVERHALNTRRADYVVLAVREILKTMPNRGGESSLPSNAVDFSLTF